MKYNISPLYRSLPKNLEDQLTAAVERGVASASSANVFFRADDVAVPSATFCRMINIFKKYQMPLCLAVVPSWFTAPRADTLLKTADSQELFCWHQHGWQHKNHELSGKKQEFGESRAENAVRDDISRGAARLADLLGENFYPVFTPPWNRCGSVTLSCLKQLSFKGLSRSAGASPPSPAGLADYQVNVDLHTRKEPDPALSLNSLLDELRDSFKSPLTGIMLHHQRIDENGFHLLELLLKTLNRFKAVERQHFISLHRQNDRP